MKPSDKFKADHIIFCGFSPAHAESLEHFFGARFGTPKQNARFQSHCIMTSGGEKAIRQTIGYLLSLPADIRALVVLHHQIPPEIMITLHNRPEWKLCLCKTHSGFLSPEKFSAEIRVWDGSKEYIDKVSTEANRGFSFDTSENKPPLTDAITFR